MARPLSRRRRRALDWAVRLPPPAVLSLLYTGLIALGTVLLKLPAATALPVTWSDALFTATSAVTVTGLVVFDPGTHFTLFGEAVLLVLIQLGGLGLMVFAVLVLSMIGLPIGMSQRMILREDLNQTSIADLLALVQRILRVVLVCELLGVVALATVFVPDFGWAEGLWHALFHTVSAFNNAGVQLFPDGLSRWVDSPVVNLAVPALFVFGGLGYSVVYEVYERREWRRFSLHTKLTLAGTAALIAWSVPAFALLEWDNPGTLGQLSGAGDRLWASWFQAVTTRTAGFNTLDIGAIHDSTALMFMLLMVVGAGSTSTAGGIKVTTFVVLILATLAFFRRRATIQVFGRSLGQEEVMKVLALAMVSLFAVMIGIFLLTIAHDDTFVQIAFEVASAFGTVGLTMGATYELDGLGRAVIMALMFIGRVGPLTLGFFLARRAAPRVRYPASRVFLG